LIKIDKLIGRFRYPRAVGINDKCKMDEKSKIIKRRSMAIQRLDLAVMTGMAWSLWSVASWSGRGSL
jgi:hypothetical protein